MIDIFLVSIFFLLEHLPSCFANFEKRKRKKNYDILAIAELQVPELMKRPFFNNANVD